MSCFPPVNIIDTNFKDTLNSDSLTADLGKCQTVYDLAGLLVKRTTKQIFREENGDFADILAIYRWAAANKARVDRQSDKCSVLITHALFIGRATNQDA